MPYISLNTAQKLTYMQKELLNYELGRTISIIPGKKPEDLMLSISDSNTFYKGNNLLEYGTFIEIRTYGKAEHSYNEAFIKATFSVLKRVLDIPKEQIYMNLIEMSNWGVEGKYI